MTEINPTGNGMEPAGNRADSLEGVDDNQTVSFYASDNPQNYSVETLDVREAAPVSQMVQPQRVGKKLFAFSKRKAMIISTSITLVVVLLTGASMLLLVRNSPEKQKQSSTTQQQDVVLKDADQTKLPSELQGTAQSLLVNGDFITRGSIKVSSNGLVTVIKSQNVTANQTITLPDASGTICLDSNNCSFVGADQFSALQSQVTALSQITIPAAGVTSLNDQNGSVTVQGSLNQINVATSGGVLTLSTPQNLDANANVQFGSLTVGPTGTIKANNLLQTGAGNSINIDAGNDFITFTAGGRIFQLPNSGVASQTICTTGASCASGGGTAVLLASGSVQNESDPSTSIFINDTGGGNLLQLQSGGVDRLTVANNGNTTVSGSLTVSSLGNGFVKSTGGVLSVLSAINLTTDVTGTLSVSNGGTGLNTIPANGVVVGNGASPVSSVVAGGTGLCLMSTAGAPSFQACPGSGSSFTVAGTSGSSQLISGGDTLTIAAGNNVTTTAGATDTVTVATVNNPNFTTSVMTPLLQNSGALAITPGGALTVGSTSQAALLQGSTSTITSNGVGNDIVLTSADQIQLTGFNCAALGNGGKLTTDASGNISCAADNGGSGSAITGTSSQTGRLAVFTGSQTIADSWLLQNGSTLELDNTRDLSLTGGNFSVTGTGTFSGLLTANGGLTVQTGDTFTFNGEAFTDLTGTGLTFNSGSLQTTLGTSIDLTTEVTGVLPVTNGGTGINGSTAANGQLFIGNGTGYSLATITQGAGITITNGSGSITVASAFGASIDSVEITDLTVTNADIANGTIDLSTKTTGNYVATIAGNSQVSVSGSGSNNAAVTLGLVADSIGDTELAFNTGQDLTTGSTPSFAGLTVSGGTFTIGTTSQLASLVLHDGNGQTTTFNPGDSAGDLIFTLPTADGSANQCIKTNSSGVLSFGDCLSSVGGGGGVTGSGTQNRLSKFGVGGTSIGDSTIADDGSTVTTTVDMAVQGGGLSVGTALQDAAITLYGNGFSAVIGTSLVDQNSIFNLPAGAGGEFCVKEIGNCSGSGGGNAPNDAQYLTLALDAGLSAERTLSFNGTNFSVTDNGANNSYVVNTAQSIDSSATPSFAGLTLTGNLQLNANTLQGTTAVIDFTNFDVASTGNITAGTYNGQTISNAASLTGTLSVAGLTTLNGGLTIEAGDTLTFNGDAITDLTGNGLQVGTNTLTLLVQATKGLEVDGNGLSLIDCASGEILKYNGSNQWACAADAGGSGVGDNVLVNGIAANDANFVNTSATATSASTSWTLNVVGPDTISLSVGVASATDAGIVTNGVQTFGGAKTFNGQIIAGAGIDIGANTLLGTTAVIDFTNFDVASNGNVTAGIYNGQTVSSAANFTGTLSVAGATTTSGGLTVNTPTGTDDQILLGVTPGGPARFNGTITATDLTGSDKTWTLPDVTGTFITSGNLVDITAVGTVTSGTWNATAITDAYVADTLTIDSSSTVDWTALNNYPSACAAGQAITAVGDTLTCAVFAAGSGSGNYIQNQNVSQQTAANFWIYGSGRADTSMLTPLLDTATAAALDVGTTNATQINLNKNVVVASGQYLKLTGDTTANRPTPSVSTEGALFYDTTTKQLMTVVYNADMSSYQWKAAGQNAVLVAASNSSAADKAAADYVATGASDQTVINYALTSASASGARKTGNVYLFGGTYTIDGSISVPNNTTLAGAGPATVIQIPNVSGATISMITNSDTSGLTGAGITIRDLKLDGRKDINASGTQYGININSIGDGSGSTYRRGGSITNVEVVRTRGAGFYISNSSNMVISGNTADDNSGGGFFLNGVAFSSITDNTAENCTNPSAAGITLLNNFLLNVKGNSLISNAVGLDLGDTSTTVSDNVFYGNTTYGLAINGSALNSIVSNNNFYENGGAAHNNSIYFTSSGTLSNSVTGNTISDSSATTDNYAIFIPSGITGTYLSNNRLMDGTISNSSVNTSIGGQLSGDNYVIQPAGTIELMKNTNVTGVLQGSTATFTTSLTVGIAGPAGTTGSIVFKNSTNSNAVTLNSGVTTGSGYTLTLPTSAGVANDCLTNTVTPGVLQFTSCAAAAGGANTALSNLTATSISQDLIASATNSTDLGSSSIVWRSGYFGTEIYTPKVGTVNNAGSTTGLIVNTGNATAAGTSGAITIQTGTTTNSTSGAITIQSGTPGGGAAAGTVTIDTGFSSGTALLRFGTTNAKTINIGNTNSTTSVIGSLATQRGSDYSTTGSTNNVNFGIGALFRLTGASAQTITGIANGVDGRMITLVNAAAQNATISNNSASSTAANRIITGTGGGMTLAPGASISMIYDTGSSFWRVVGSTSAVGGGTYVNLQGSTPGTADVGNFNITGTGIAATLQGSTNVLTPTIDVISAGTLNVGIGTATAVSISKSGATTTINGALTVTQASIFNGAATFNSSVVVAASQSLTITGGTTGTRPGSPTEGMLYYDTTTKQLLVYANGKWQADRSTATKIIAPSNASQTAKDTADVVLTGTSDQTLINTALTAATGGKVYILEGTVTINGSISIPNNTVLSGAGRGTRITIPNSHNAALNMIVNTDTTTGTGVTIQDLQLDGNKSGQASGAMDGINLTGMGSGSGVTAVPGAKLTNLWVTNMTQDGISLNTSSNNTVTANTSQGNTCDGIYLNASNNNIITSNSLSGSSTCQGLYIDAVSTYNTVTGNNIQGNSVEGVLVSANSPHNTVTGNTFEGNYDGIDVSSSDNTVTGNTFYNNTIGIYVINGVNNSITGNSINGSLYQGIQLYGSSYNTVSGNTITNTADIGIELNGLSNYNNITANTVVDSNGAAFNDAIGITDSDNNSITNNVISDSSATTNNYAIAIYANTADANYLAGNNLGGGSINDAGTGTVYGGQVDGSTNYVIQPAGTIELMKNTNVTGTLNISSNVDTNGSLTVGNANQFVISNTGVVTSGTWQAGTIGVQYGGTGGTTFTQYGVLFGNGTGAFGATATGSTGQCLLSGNGVAAPTWGTCTVSSLQSVYNASSTAPTAAEIVLADNKNLQFTAADTTTDPSIVMKLNCTGCGVGATGNFIIQNNSSAALFNVAGSGAIQIGTANNGISLSGSGGTTTGTFTLSGTARNLKTITLNAEYAGAVLDSAADGTCNTGPANNGTMTSGYTTSGTGTKPEGYYTWTSTQATAQCYDVVVQIPIPSDFDGFAGTQSINTWSNDLTNGTLALDKSVDGSADGSAYGTSLTPGSASTWTNKTFTFAGSYTSTDANKMITFRIRMSAAKPGGTAAQVNLGRITLQYNSKF